MPVKKSPVKKSPVKKSPVKKQLVKQKACPQGKKMTLTGGRCIQDKGYMPKAQRQTVCLEGYRISKGGKCIKDKKGQPAAKRQTVCLEGYKISKNGKCIKDKNYKIVIEQGPVRRPTGFKTARSRALSVVPSRAPSFADFMRARSASL